jgi:hypothetical protein
MLYSVPKTELQVILPYIVGTLGVAGMFVWRRKRGK